VFGVIPESLLPVIGYACAVAIVAWVVVGTLAIRLIKLAAARRRDSSNGRKKVQ
jgi:hypothetical protein